MTVFVRKKTDPAQIYMGEVDGPMRFIPAFGMEVPTYINPREDLRPKVNCLVGVPTLDYHVPHKFRGAYFSRDLHDFDPEKHYPKGKGDKVRCDSLRKDGTLCQRLAVNYSGFCAAHGGALHPADKMFSIKRGVVPSDISQLSRSRKVALGIIPVNELSDEEIAKGQIREENGTWCSHSLIERRIYEDMKKEFFVRAERMMQEQAFDMIKVMRDMALSEVNEPKDRIQAAQWNIERILGKTPDVLITHQSDKPFESILSAVTGGSREDYRNQENAALEMGNIIEGEVVSEDADDEDEIEDEIVGDSLEDEGSVNDEETETESAYASVVAIASKKEAIKEAQNRIKKARNRRYAARAQGSDSLTNIAYEVKFVQEKKLAGTGTLRMKLIAPDDMKPPNSR